MYTDKLFTGQREMAGLGIYHFGARFYSPYINRFLSADTVVPNPANPQDLNRYSYVRNNPIRYIDPTGHVCTDPETVALGKATCYGSGTTRVGNTMVTGNGAELGAAKNLPAGFKKPPSSGNTATGDKSCTSVACLTTSTPQSPTPSPSETLTSVNIGGVNPASAPGISDDDSVPVITNIQGSAAVGIPAIISLISPIIQQPSTSTSVNVWLNYTTLSNGSINSMVVALDNRTTGSAVDLSGVVLRTQPIIGSADSSFLRPINYVGVGPGQVAYAAVCSKCIATNVLAYEMPVDRNTEITITVMVGATYNFGLTGTNYGQLPVSYVIPPR